MVGTLTDAEFNDKIKNSEKPIVVDFWAEWCGPCKQLSPTLASVAEELSDKVDVYKMNVDENTETPTTFGIRGIPTLIMFKNGEKIAAKSGNLPKQALTDWINENT